MLKLYIEQLIKKQSLERNACREAFTTILVEDVAAEQIAAFLALLHAKGETVAEILGAIDALQSQMLTLAISEKTLDIVGTGGDYSNSLNISTAAAILAASCGVKIAKHGNRAVSSQCGSADVLEALNVDITMPPEKIAQSIQQFNIGFCFAPKFHPIMAKLRQLRRRLGIPTIFNLIGPFLNPTMPRHYLMGSFSADLLPKFADILAEMQLEKSAIVHCSGMDEMSCTGINKVIFIEDGRPRYEEIDPKTLGLSMVTQGDLQGGSADYNAMVIKNTLAGEVNSLTDTLALNAGMAIYIYGLSSNLRDAIASAKANLSKGVATQVLKNWQEIH